MADFDQNTYQPIAGDMYILEIRSGKEDIQALIAPMQFLGKSKGKRRYYRPTGTQE